MIRLFLKRPSDKRGQSFTELALILLILALLLAGVVEYGFLLNTYLHVLDAAREGARFSSNSNPFKQDPVTKLFNPNVREDYFYAVTSAEVASVLDPVVLQISTDNNNPNANINDDVVISVFSMAYQPWTSSYSIVRYPVENQSGWSLCANYGAIISYFNYIGTSIPPSLSAPSWTNGNCVPQASKFTTASITNRLRTTAPGTGALVVEIFYHYSQTLAMPIFSSMIPNPIPIYTYTIMPLSAAEPTPTP